MYISSYDNLRHSLLKWKNCLHLFFDYKKSGKRGYIGDNSDQFVVGPEFCGGALSKGI